MTEIQSSREYQLRDGTIVSEREWQVRNELSLLKTRHENLQAYHTEVMVELLKERHQRRDAENERDLAMGFIEDCDLMAAYLAGRSE